MSSLQQMRKFIIELKDSLKHKSKYGKSSLN